MITMKLKGGLGNQMFQYAAGKCLAHRLNTSLNLDIGFYGYKENIDTKWPFQLMLFGINAKTSKGIGDRLSLMAKIRRKITGSRESIYREDGFKFNLAFNNLPDGTILDGYWQSEKYFNDIRDILLDEIVPVAKPSEKNARLMAEMEAAPNSVSLHVRRGDYITNEKANAIHGMAGLDYYVRTVNNLADKIGPVKIYVFSDDPAWCEQNLKTGQETVYVANNSGDDSYWDMILMSKCRHHIIANSSFSWWGAWLGRNDDKIVYAPEKWFNDQSVDTSDIVPAGWIRI